MAEERLSEYPARAIAANRDAKVKLQNPATGQTIMRSLFLDGRCLSATSIRASGTSS